MAETWSHDPLVEPGATVHPGDEVAAVVDEALGLELRLFKLHCAVGAFSLDDERLGPLWTRVSDRGLPVVVHLGHSPAGPTEPGELATLDRVASAWPEARIVLAHLAAPSVHEALAVVRRHRSLHADLTPVVFHPVPLGPGDLDGVAHRDPLRLGPAQPRHSFRRRGRARTGPRAPPASRPVFAGNADRLVPPRGPADAGSPGRAA